MIFSLKILLVFIADFLLGDPPGYPHPVRCTGYLIDRFEGFTRQIFSFNLCMAGFFTALLTLVTVLFILGFIFCIAGSISGGFAEFLGLFFMYTSISLKDLRAEAIHVYLPLVQRENLQRARRQLSRIVGRDTARLDRAGIIRGAVETVAENSSDGITAPVFWAIVGSLFAYFFGKNEILWAAYGCMAYKTINTMDSMLGYKNEKYRAFGFFPAKIDDLVNYFPARLTALSMVIAAFIIGKNYKKSMKILVRDCRNHTSPNAGFPEAAVAGALDIQLGGSSFYGGVLYRKPSIGDNSRRVQAVDILTTNKLSFVSSFIFLLFMLVVKALLQLLC